MMLMNKLLSNSIEDQLEHSFRYLVDGNFTNLFFETKYWDARGNSPSWVRQVVAEDWSAGGFEHGEAFFILSAFTLDVVCP